MRACPLPPSKRPSPVPLAIFWSRFKLFDVYRGAPVPAGKKSVAYSLVLRAADRTLTVEECDKAIEKALKALSQYGITLRA